MDSSKNGVNGKAVNGGIPQLGNLTKHLELFRQNVSSMIVDPDYSGLAVIDWEQWDPLWARNWDSRQIYRDASIELAKKENPDLPIKEVTEIAHAQFEKSARSFMEATLLELKKIRPNAKWGYYRFPDCHDGFSQCSEKIRYIAYPVPKSVYDRYVEIR